MNELEITYGYTKGQKITCMIIGGYFSLYGLYQSVMLALNSSFHVDFYLALAAVILGVVLQLSVTMWAVKPLVRINLESIFVNMPASKAAYSAEWIAVKEVSIGISYLKFAETDGKSYNADLSGLKYSDLKDVKTRVVEICESKNIPYRND